MSSSRTSIRSNPMHARTLLVILQGKQSRTEHHRSPSTAMWKITKNEHSTLLGHSLIFPALNSRNLIGPKLRNFVCRRAEPLSISDMPGPRTSGSPTRPCFFPNRRIIWGRDRAPGVVYSSDLVFRDVDIDVARPTSLVRCESPVEAALGDVRQVHGICSAICHADGAWVDHRAKWIYKGQRLLSNFPLWRSEDRLGLLGTTDGISRMCLRRTHG